VFHFDQTGDTRADKRRRCVTAMPARVGLCRSQGTSILIVDVVTERKGKCLQSLNGANTLAGCDVGSASLVVSRHRETVPVPGGRGRAGNGVEAREAELPGRQ
jgi:hypothetical protein